MQTIAIINFNFHWLISFVSKSWITACPCTLQWEAASKKKKIRSPRGRKIQCSITGYMRAPA